MKKKNLCHLVFSALVIAVLTSSCSVLGLTGSIYTQVKAPHALNVNEVGTKVGTSEALSVLGLVAIGDYGYNEAISKGNIKKVSHVDVETFSVLGLFTKVKLYVYGN